MRFYLLLSVFLSISATAFAQQTFTSVKCQGDYAHHLQGICTDKTNALFWSFTTELVKTDPTGKVQKSIEVPTHHGDLCFYDGKIYVAVNLGLFNHPEGKADSWVYVYDAKNLTLLKKHETQEVFHGAGGMAEKDGHFYIIGGLPDGVPENYIYEYDANLTFLKKHIIKSGWTRLGVQTAAWHDNAWWFGCYGDPKILIKTGPDFKNPERFEFNASLGIVGLSKGKIFVAKGPKTTDGRREGSIHVAVPSPETGLKILPD